MHKKVFLAVLAVVKTSEESFTGSALPANEALETFISSDFTCEMWLTIEVL